MKPGTPQAELFARLGELFTGEALFDSLADVVYFIKNARGEYVVVNQTLVKRCGFAHKKALIGKTPDEVFPFPLGKSYRTQDEAILRTGEPIFNRLELHLYPSGETGWCLTNKIALRGRHGDVVGLVGISRDLHEASNKSKDLSQVAEVIEHIHPTFPFDGPESHPPPRSTMQPWSAEPICCRPSANWRGSRYLAMSKPRCGGRAWLPP